MSLTIEQARDLICDRFRTEWLADSFSQNIPILWDDTRGEPPEAYDGSNNPQPWTRLTVQHAAGGQNTLANDVGARQFGRSGLVTAQIFAPAADGLRVADDLAEIAARAFESQTAGSVWFRNVRYNEVGLEGIWFQVNVIAEFTYDQQR